MRANRTTKLLLALGGVLVGGALVSPRFFELSLGANRVHGALVDVLESGAPTMLVALGMTLVIAAGGIDLSVGATMAIAGTVAALSIGHAPLLVVLLAVLLGGAVIGSVNGLLVSLVDVQPLVATLVVLTAGRGLAQCLAGGQVVPCQEPGLSALANGAWLMVPAPLWLVLAAYLLLELLLRATHFGLGLACTGDNPRAARLLGMRVTAISVAAFVICGIASALAGILATAEIEAADADKCGLYSELDAILAVVIGGTPLQGGRARLLGTLLGVAIVQALSTALMMANVGRELALCAKGLLVLLVCAIDRRGAG